MNTASLLHGFRFIDNFFPSGGYAFSFGLEAAVQAKTIHNSENLRDYIADLLKSGMGSREAVAVGLAHSEVIDQTLQTAQNVDEQLEAMKTCRESRLASRQMGRHILRIAGGGTQSPTLLRQFLAHVESDQSPGHMAVSLGLVLGVFGWKKRDAIAAYLYQSAVGLISASLKLFSIGQREGQHVLERLIPLIDQVSHSAETKTEMLSWAPIQDIYEMRHTRLTTRMFRS